MAEVLKVLARRKMMFCQMVESNLVNFSAEVLRMRMRMQKKMSMSTGCGASVFLVTSMILSMSCSSF